MEKDITLKEIVPLRVGRALTQIPRESLIDTEDEQFFNGKCPYVINTPTITPNGSVYACCCFGDAQTNPHDLIGYCGNVNTESFEDVFEGMQKNLIFNIFSKHGPYSLLKMIVEQQKEIVIRGKYLSTCDICVELYHNPNVRKSLSEFLTKMVKATL